MRISDWSSDVCSSDLLSALYTKRDADAVVWRQYEDAAAGKVRIRWETLRWPGRGPMQYEVILAPLQDATGRVTRSEEHTSELQSLMRISYAVFCLNKNKNKNNEI